MPIHADHRVIAAANVSVQSIDSIMLLTAWVWAA